jgi:hypothetical protein
MILQKVTFKHGGRNAISVDDFYYRGIEDKLEGRKGTGIRSLAADFIRQGKAIDRFLILKEDGCVLESYMIFKTMEHLNEFNRHPINLRAGNIFADKGWSKTVEVFPIQDYLNVRDQLDNLPSVI